MNAHTESFYQCLWAAFSFANVKNKLLRLYKQKINKVQKDLILKFKKVI